MNEERPKGQWGMALVIGLATLGCLALLFIPGAFGRALLPFSSRDGRLRLLRRGREERDLGFVLTIARLNDEVAAGHALHALAEDFAGAPESFEALLVALAYPDGRGRAAVDALGRLWESGMLTPEQAAKLRASEVSSELDAWTKQRWAALQARLRAASSIGCR